MVLDQNCPNINHINLLSLLVMVPNDRDQQSKLKTGKEQLNIKLPELLQLLLQRLHQLLL